MELGPDPLIPECALHWTIVQQQQLPVFNDATKKHYHVYKRGNLEPEAESIDGLALNSIVNTLDNNGTSTLFWLRGENQLILQRRNNLSCCHQECAHGAQARVSKQAPFFFVKAISGVQCTMVQKKPYEDFWFPANNHYYDYVVLHVLMIEYLLIPGGGAIANL